MREITADRVYTACIRAAKTINEDEGGEIDLSVFIRFLFEVYEHLAKMRCNDDLMEMSEKGLVHVDHVDDDGVVVWALDDRLSRVAV